MYKFKSTEVELDYDDVLICPNYRSHINSRSEVSLVKKFTFKHSGFCYETVPIIAANMNGIGTKHMAEAMAYHTCMVAYTKTVSPNAYSYNNTFYTIGVNEALTDILNKTPNFINVDIANGHMIALLNRVRELRQLFPMSVIMAGNVVSGYMTTQLIDAGADIVKVGIGPGSVCTTRLKTGVGRPQLSAIAECAEAAQKMGAHICADGGCKNPGDVSKALAAGADFVMLGGMLAGHEEGLDDLTSEMVWNAKIKEYEIHFYGSSSKQAMGTVAEYRTDEGKTVKIKYRGSVKNTMQDILGGVRSACSYVGASNLEEFRYATVFVRVNNTHNRVFG